MSDLGWRLRAVLVAGLLSLTLGSAAAAKPPVWVVRDSDSELVLFGSIHVLPPGLDWEPKELTTALANADDVWFELPIDPASQLKVAELATARGVLAPGKSLIGLLSKKGQERLIRLCQRFHLSPGLMDRFQPWYAEVILASAEFRASGADSASGVEESLAVQAPPRVERRALESAEQQIEMLAGASLADQKASLEDSLAQMDTDPRAYDRLVRAWMAGDLRSLDREALTPLRKASPNIYRRMLLDRNTAWVAALDQRLKGHGKTVVVVGVGHLIGEAGAPARLRALGYSVEGP